MRRLALVLGVVLSSLAACGGDDAPTGGANAATPNADASSGGSDGASGDPNDGGPALPPSDLFVRSHRGVNKQFPGGAVRVVRGNGESYLTFGNRAPDAAQPGKAFLAKHDLLGKQLWELDLGTGHVTQVRATATGYLVTGHGTTDFDRGSGGVILAVVGEDGKSSFTTRREGLNRGLGVGLLADGSYLVAGMTTNFVQNGWELGTFRFDAKGTYVSAEVVDGPSYADYVQQSVVLPDASTYLINDSRAFPDLVKIDAEGKELWGHAFGQAFTLDDSGNVVVADGEILRRYSADGVQIGADVRWTKPGYLQKMVNRDVVLGPAGRVALVGFVASKDDFNRTTGTFPYAAVLDETGKTVAKIDLDAAKGSATFESAVFVSPEVLVVTGTFQKAFAFPGMPQIEAAAGEGFVARVKLTPEP